MVSSVEKKRKLVNVNISGERSKSISKNKGGGTITSTELCSECTNEILYMQIL